MIILFGLGNHDPKYVTTKHNAGRIVLENMAKIWGATFQHKLGFAWAKHEIANETIWLIYSLGYMNSSGEPLAQFIRYFKLHPSEIQLLILQDDSDQQEGKQKLLPAGGSAGHHGINSIYTYALSLKLNMDSIWRLKLGIRPVGNRLKSETFVLHLVSTHELNHYDQISNELVKLLHKPPIDWGKWQTKLNGLSTK